MELKEAQVAQDYKFAEKYTELGFVPPHLAVLHNDFKTVDLEKHLAFRNRFRGSMETTDIQSFVDYVVGHRNEEGAILGKNFINAHNPKRSLSVETVFNLGNCTEAGHADDVASLNLSKDDLFTEFLNEFNGEKFSPLKLAEALDNQLGSVEMTAYNGDTLTIQQAIAIFRNAKSDAAQKTQVQGGQFKQEVSEFEQVEVSSNVGDLPEYILVESPLYLGLEKQWLRFKVIVDVADNGEGKKKMLFSLKFLGETAAYMRAAENFKALITEQLGADNTFIGTYANK